MINNHPFVRRSAWLASLLSVTGNAKQADSYVMGIVVWYTTSGGQLVVK